ncbi:LOW QUALITY PROTEIN: hypothetical protein MC885_007876 [Smutsia gigantea]|nr:LOW QUALITY PROTEIN: hypothetical protein MC885_007876 [Smutsia gigantea]
MKVPTDYTSQQARRRTLPPNPEPGEESPSLGAEGPSLCLLQCPDLESQNCSASRSRRGPRFSARLPASPRAPAPLRLSASVSSPSPSPPPPFLGPALPLPASSSSLPPLPSSAAANERPPVPAPGAVRRRGRGGWGVGGREGAGTPGSGAGAGGAGTGDPRGGGGGGQGKPRGRSCGCGARGPERPPSPERGPAGRPPPLRMSRCSSRALTLLSSVFGACGLLLVGIAVSTDYWLYMEEGTVLPQNQTTEVKMALHAGLWRVCFFAGREKGRCVASEYFLEPEINLVTENTENILKTVRTATPFPMVSLFLVFTAFVISNIGHIRPQRTILAFVSGIFFILSGLSLVVGLVLYISSINDERYAEEEMYRPHPAFYRPRLSDCSDYSGQFLQPEAWRRGRSPSDISSDVSIQMTQNYPPAIKYPDHLHISTSPC